MDAMVVWKHWTQVREGLNTALDLLADDQLDFTPRAGLWSLRETVCHIATVEKGWFRYIITHEVSGWAEAEYPPASYPSVAALKALLAEEHARSVAYFLPDLEEKLAQPVLLPWGKETSVAWILLHVLEHEIHHRGEVYLMLGMLGIEAPDV
jgi:uncharacterized damage-inducible protein DinB